MDEEQLFLFEDDPLPEEISQEPEPCQFCGGKPHINQKHMAVKFVRTGGLFGGKLCDRKAVYVYCGRCRARGPIVARTLKRRSEEDEMKVEAIRKWNGMQGRT